MSTNDIFTLLWKHGARFCDSSFGDTPLHWAAGEGRLEVVRKLVDICVDLDASNGEGVTPLLAAALAGRVGAALGASEAATVWSGTHGEFGDEGGWVARRATRQGIAACYGVVGCGLFHLVQACRVFWRSLPSP